MKKEWADKWVAALRSGKYQQTTGSLKSHDGKFCCLGVLCDIVDNKKWAKESFTTLHSYEGVCGVVPKSVMDITGLSNDNGMPVDILFKFSSLASMNDIGLYTFNDIADIIEKYWEYL